MNTQIEEWRSQRKLIQTKISKLKAQIDKDIMMIAETRDLGESKLLKQKKELNEGKLSKCQKEVAIIQAKIQESKDAPKAANKAAKLEKDASDQREALLGDISMKTPEMEKLISELNDVTNKIKTLNEARRHVSKTIANKRFRKKVSKEEETEHQKKLLRARDDIRDLKVTEDTLLSKIARAKEEHRNATLPPLTNPAATRMPASRPLLMEPTPRDYGGPYQNPPAGPHYQSPTSSRQGPPSFLSDQFTREGLPTPAYAFGGGYQPPPQGPPSFSSDQFTREGLPTPAYAFGGGYQPPSQDPYLPRASNTLGQPRGSHNQGGHTSGAGYPNPNPPPTNDPRSTGPPHDEPRASSQGQQPSKRGRKR